MKEGGGGEGDEREGRNQGLQMGLSDLHLYQFSSETTFIGCK